MFRTRLFTLLSVFLWSIVTSQAIDLSKVNLSYQYDPESDIFFDHRVVDAGDSLTVFYSVRFDTINSWNQTFLIQDHYQSMEHDTLKTYSISVISEQPGERVYRLSMVKPKKSLLIIAWYDLNRGVYRVEDVRVKTPVGFPAFYPADEEGMPVLKDYVSSEGVRFIGMEEYHAFQYTDNFDPADPAMGRMKPIAPSLRIDSSFMFSNQLSSMDVYSFYLVQEDTLSQAAITLLSCPSYFPEFRRLEELIPPLTYITTETEINTLKGKMNKGSFENFWVNTYGSRFRAKSAIKNYYNQIERVNELFTDYKQGWKTDRGVIYLIFGKPDKVFRTEREEVWKYISGVEFEFIRISTLFTSSMYSLKRDRSYEQTWYNRVGELRKGM